MSVEHYSPVHEYGSVAWQCYEIGWTYHFHTANFENFSCSSKDQTVIANIGIMSATNALLQKIDLKIFFCTFPLFIFPAALRVFLKFSF